MQVGPLILCSSFGVLPSHYFHAAVLARMRTRRGSIHFFGAESFVADSVPRAVLPLHHFRFCVRSCPGKSSVVNQRSILTLYASRRVRLCVNAPASPSSPHIPPHSREVYLVTLADLKLLLFPWQQLVRGQRTYCWLWDGNRDRLQSPVKYTVGMLARPGPGDLTKPT